MHDLVIRGGRVVDGSGGEPLVTDIAVDNGTIAAIGRVSARGREEIDAREHIVTPGFADLHTHLDAQIGWDPTLTPLPQHGVTTALMGNCGMTFAPVRGSDHALCARLLEDTESAEPVFALGQLFWLGEDEPDYGYPEQNSLQALAAQRRKHPAATFLHLSRESQGQVLRH